MWLDIISTKKTYDYSIKGNRINGYIQSLSRQPIVIHMYCEDQILLLKHFNWGEITLHLDATGSVVRKIDKEQKRFLYYAITIKHPEAKISPIPIAEMLTSDHTNVEISHFLSKWLYAAKQVLNKEFIPAHIEIDFSWAMLHGVCRSFNQVNLEEYLTSCWELNATNNFPMIRSRTVIHLCSAHIIRRFSYQLDHGMKPPKQIKKRLLFVMARMIDCESLEEIDQIFDALIISCSTRKIYPEIKDYITKLENVITFKKEQVDLDVDYIDDLDEELHNDLGDGSTYKNRSPFGKHFTNSLTRCQYFISELEDKYVHTLHFEDNNIFFHPKWPEFLTTHYMPICPLWTGTVLVRVLPSWQKDNRYSNAIIENWMRIVKKNILANEVKLRPADFIRKLREGIFARQKAFEFGFLPISSNIFKRARCKDTNLMEEVWKRRKTSKRSYFSSYKVPKKSKVGESKIKHKKTSIKQKTEYELENRQKNFEKCEYLRFTSATSSSDKKLFDYPQCEESSDSLIMNNTITIYPHGEFSPIDTKWQKEKCKKTTINVYYRYSIWK